MIKIISFLSLFNMRYPASVAGIMDLTRWATMIATIPFLWMITGFYLAIPIIAKIGFLLIYNDTNSVVEGIYQRVEIILGIFMIFKVTIELVKMLANPDLLTDKEKGISGIVSRIPVTLILLAITPLIFKEAYILQNRVLEDNLIGKIILGDSTSLNGDTFFAYGNEMAWETLNSFYYLEDKDELCASLTPWKGSAQANLYIAAEALIDKGLSSIINTDINTDSDFAGFTEEEIGEQIIRGQGYGRALLCTYSKKHVIGVITPSLPGVLTAALSTGVGYYSYSMTYFPIFAMIFSIYVVWVLLSHCFNLALRAVQLIFLQLIAPIPIISYINDKNGTFSKWVAQCLDTYLDVFFRLAVVHFTVLLIHLINGIDSIDTSQLSTIPLSIGGNSGVQFLSISSFFNVGIPLYRMFVKPLLIIGLLRFSKKAPEMVKELFPRKSAAAIDMEPNKKLGGTLGGMIVSGVTNAVGYATNKKKFDPKATRKDVAKSALFGGLKGSAQGAYKGYKGGIMGAFQNAAQSNSAHAKWVQEGGKSPFGYAKSAVSRQFGMPTEYQMANYDITRMEEENKKLGNIKTGFDNAASIGQKLNNKGQSRVDLRDASGAIVSKDYGLDAINMQDTVNMVSSYADSVAKKKSVATYKNVDRDRIENIVAGVLHKSSSDQLVQDFINERLSVDPSTGNYSTDETELAAKLSTFIQRRSEKVTKDSNERTAVIKGLLETFTKEAGTGDVDSVKAMSDILTPLVDNGYITFDTEHNDIEINSAAENIPTGVRELVDLCKRIKDAGYGLVSDADEFINLHKKINQSATRKMAENASEIAQTREQNKSNAANDNFNK